MAEDGKKLVSEDAKREFDALHALSEQVWRDWDHKSKHEWRLSFGLWAALLASSAALLQTEYRPTQTQTLIIGGGLVVLILLHVWFLAWIQGRLWDYRTEYLDLRQRMPEPVKPVKPSDRSRCWCKSPSLWTQVVVTLLLSAVLAMVALSEPSKKQPLARASNGPTTAAADGLAALWHI